MTSPTITSTNVHIDWSTQTMLPVEFGGREVQLEARAYQGKKSHEQALVLTRKDMAPRDTEIASVRIHSGCVTGDIFHSLRCDCYQQLQAAIVNTIDTRNGILIYLPYQEGRGIGLVKKIQAYAAQDKGLDTVDANLEIGEPIDARDYKFAAAILRDLGITRVRLLTNNPDKVESISLEGVEVVEQVPVRAKPGEHNKTYLETKRARMDHKI